MSKIKRILMATDGSELSKKAAAFAGDLARAFDASLTLVIVHDEQSVIPDAWNVVGTKLESNDPVSTEDVRKRIEANALANDLAQTAGAAGDLSTEPVLVNLWGHAADQICDYAATNNMDMIVIGSHGRSGIKKALLGSVSHSVVNSATCAVTVVR
ncbi:MAG: universal stress protein [Gammaproteobacteria bacterium]|nr:universal stress protein [Gammaproteobacteria bacterium]